MSNCNADEIAKAYNLGWNDGYNDLPPNNTYPEGSEEHEQYNEGYEQGSRDC